MAKLVNWVSFEKKIKEKRLLLFSNSDVCRVLGVSKVAAIFLLHRYAKKGLISRIKRGIYVFPDIVPSDLYIANKLYEPSYVSLEFALSYHRVIPETVYEITSVTTKATRRFSVLRKTYSYRKLKRAAFTGYYVVQKQGVNFVIADPEKAFVDAIYFRVLSGEKPIIRFDKGKINIIKAVKYTALFNNPKLVAIVKRTLR
jgi:predicted transcriptional regulator of viral defense system